MRGDKTGIRLCLLRDTARRVGAAERRRAERRAALPGTLVSRGSVVLSGVRWPELFHGAAPKPSRCSELLGTAQ